MFKKVLAALALAALFLSGKASLAQDGRPGAPPPQSYWVEAEDRIRVKTFSVSSIRYALRIKFMRRSAASTGEIVTATKILSPNNVRGSGLPPMSGTGSFAFGEAAGWGRTVYDAAITSAGTTLTSATAAFVAADAGKQITIAGACVAGYQGDNCPSALYQGQITTVTSGTEVEVWPAATATVSSAQLIIEPPLLADQDGRELGDGWLIGVDANYWAGTGNDYKRGQIYIECEINRVAFNHHEGNPLFQGYLGGSEHLGWPYGVSERKVSGHGGIKTYAIANPANATDLVITVPANARWKLISVRSTFIASASVGNRVLNSILVDDGTNVIFSTGAVATVVASGAMAFTLAPLGETKTVGTNAFYIATPIGMVLSEGYRIRTSMSGMLTTDLWQLTVICVEEWIEE